MLKRSIPSLVSAKKSTVSPLQLIGIKGEIGKSGRRKEKTQLKDFLVSSLSEYPLNLILSNKISNPSYQVNKILMDIREMEKVNTDRDINDLPILIDYKILDKTKNPYLYNTFKEHYGMIDLLPHESFITILSFTKDLLDRDTTFIKSLGVKYGDYFTLKSCILNTHIFPFLKEITRDADDNSSVNLFEVARYGLVTVNKMDNGSLVLVNTS